MENSSISFIEKSSGNSVSVEGISNVYFHLGYFAILNESGGETTIRYRRYLGKTTIRFLANCYPPSGVFFSPRITRYAIITVHREDEKKSIPFRYYFGVVSYRISTSRPGARERFLYTSRIKYIRRPVIMGRPRCMPYLVRGDICTMTNVCSRIFADCRQVATIVINADEEGGGVFMSAAVTSRMRLLLFIFTLKLIWRVVRRVQDPAIYYIRILFINNEKHLKRVAR